MNIGTDEKKKQIQEHHVDARSPPYVYINNYQQLLLNI